MIRVATGAAAPAFLVLLLAATCAPRPASAAGPPAAASGFTSIRTACDPDGRCFETGDPSVGDDDRPPSPRRRYDPDDDQRPPARRFDPDDGRPPPPPRGRYDPDDD